MNTFHQYNNANVIINNEFIFDPCDYIKMLIDSR